MPRTTTSFRLRADKVAALENELFADANRWKWDSKNRIYPSYVVYAVVYAYCMKCI